MEPNAGLTIRRATPPDEAFLLRMLFYAANMPADGATSPAAALQNPYLAKFVDGWGAPGDLGVIAEKAGRPLGAAWVRSPDLAPHGFEGVPEGVPELAIAVLPELVGRGVGGMLLAALLESARGRYPALVLSVRAENPARRLYERHGFAVVAEVTNRVGTRSVVMLARLSS